VTKPYFDADLNAWFLSRHADVHAAFHSPDLVLVGPASKSDFAAMDEEARLRMRAETRDVLSPAALRGWRKHIVHDARVRVASFDCDHAVDLIKDYAEPLCLSLAILVTQPEPLLGRHHINLAAEVSQAAADPFDESLRSRSKTATAALRLLFHKGPETLRDSGFVALSQTLVSLLANAWYALARHPQEWHRLHMRPALVARGVEELQRFAGLTRLLFRRAIADTTINGLSIRKGDRVVLSLLAANRDPLRHPMPNQFSVDRARISHFSLGAGPHACVAAPLIRTAMMAATLALVERFSSVRLARPIEWRGGIGFVSPVTLPVLLDQ
jgi:cytochrome P450